MGPIFPHNRCAKIPWLEAKGKNFLASHMRDNTRKGLSKARPRSKQDAARAAAELERENRELRTANEILKKASAYFAQAELDRPFRK